MPLSEQLAAYAARRLDARRALLGERAMEAEALFPTLSPDEATLLRYHLATLPLTDAVDAPLEVLLAFARHALMLRAAPGLPGGALGGARPARGRARSRARRH